MRELAFYFLDDPKKFQEHFQRVLDRTTKLKGRKSNKVEFWIEFFRSMALTIQNTQLGKEREISHVCVSIGKVGNSNTNILKLAFKINYDGKDQVILRSISIREEGTTPTSTHYSGYSGNEIKVIENLIFEGNARKDPSTTVHLEEADSKVFHINIKDSNILLSDNESPGQGSSGEGAQNIKLVQPLQLGAVQQGQDKTFDTMLDLISNPATASGENVEAFFDNLIKLYNTNPPFHDYVPSEAATHGFTYGLFTLMYKDRYALDTYVEQSAGKGFLDIVVTFRKMYDRDQNSIIDTDAGSRIIGELKSEDTLDASAQAAIDQIKNKGYNYNLYGRTNSESLIAVGLNFDRGTESERIKVDMSLRPESTENFISEIVKLQSIDKTSVEPLLKNIYHSIRSEEPLHLVILGNLLSQNNLSKIRVFSIDQEEFTAYTKEKSKFSDKGKASDAQITIFSFEHNSEHIMLTIADNDQSITAEYYKKVQVCPYNKSNRYFTRY